MMLRRAEFAESPLTAIAGDPFDVEADPKLIGIYSDGTMDEWPRPR
jgi:hypothetical protein